MNKGDDLTFTLYLLKSKDNDFTLVLHFDHSRVVNL